MMNIFLFIILTVATSLAQSSYVPSTQLLKAKGHQLGVSADYFKTTEHVHDTSEKTSLADGFSFHRIQAEASGYYGATDILQFGVGVRYRKNEAQFLQGNEEITATGSGVQSTFVNIMYGLPRVDQFQFAVEGTYRFTPYTNQEFDETKDDIQKLILGDDGHEVSAGVGVTYLGANNNFLTARGGFRRPGRDLSQELYWQAEGALAWKHVALVAGVDFVTSLNNDPYENRPEEKPVYNKMTNLYAGQNREWVTPYVGLNLALKNWRLELRGSQVVRGHSTDLGNAFGIHLIRRVDKADAKTVDTKFKEYDLEANITKISPKKVYVVVDKGIADGISKGMRFDFYEDDYVGGNVLVASGVVIKLKAETAIVKITNRYNSKKELKEGLLGRASFK